MVEGKGAAMKKYVIIGNGVAGTTAAEEIRKRDAEGKITILTGESFPFYWRVRLIDYLAAEVDEEGLLAKKEDWYKEKNIDLLLNTRVVSGDAKEKTVKTEDGQTFEYDRLLIATGSHSFVPPIKGADKKGVFTIRSLQDAREAREYAKSMNDLVLIGGGLLGLESGNSLRKMGPKPTVVEFFPRLLPRQLDEEGAKLLQGLMEKMGFSFHLGATTKEILGGDKVTGILLESGDELKAEMVVISAGVRPNMELAESLGLEKDKGIKVNESLLTNQQDIYAAGDVAEFKGMPYGIWPAAMEQGKIAGANMAGENLTYGGTTMANVLKVVGVDLASAGEIDVDNKFQSKTVKGEGLYKKIVIDDNRIIGCIMLGDTGKFNQVKKMMEEKQDVSGKVDSFLE
jgi:nitrite reductase (NADH) large subunit